MNTQPDYIQLMARVFWKGTIHLKTGLHIGGSQGGIDIGGLDLPIIRNPLDRLPYIPGSSLKGKLRSLLEKAHGLPQHTKLGDVRIHTCKDDPNKYPDCPVCPLFGVPAETKIVSTPTPTRLVARDAHLVEEKLSENNKKLKALQLDSEFAELKTEVVIDRITSQAMPRTQERVPAGAEFDFELVVNLYDVDIDAQLEQFSKRLNPLVQALELLQGDFLGGQGSRGSGKVELCDLKIFATSSLPFAYRELGEHIEYENLAALVKDGWLEKIKAQLKLSQEAAEEPT